MGAAQSTLDLLGSPSDEQGSNNEPRPIGHWTTKGTLDLLESTPAKSYGAPMSQLEAAGLGYKTGVSSNWYPEFKAVSEASGLPPALGGFRMPVGAVKLIGEAPEFGGTPGKATETFYNTRNEARRDVKRGQEQFPLTTFGTDVAGGFMQPISRVRPASIAERVVEQAGKGAVMGGVRGASDGGGVEGAVQGAIPGAVIGGAIGAAGPSPKLPPQPNPAVEANTRLKAGAPVGLLTDNPALQRIYQAGREIPFLNNLPFIGPDRPVRKALQTMESTVQDIAGHLGPMINPADRQAVGSGLKSGMADTYDFNAAKAEGEFENLRRSIQPNREVPTPPGVVAQLDKIVQDRTARGESPELTGWVKNINDLLRRPQGASFEGMKQARSILGKAITWDSINNGGVEEMDLRAAKNAVTDAMENNVRVTAKGNPDKTVEAWRDANFAHQQKMDENEELNKLIRTGSSEQLTNKALSWANAKSGDYDALRKLHSSVSDADWGNLGALAVHTMGQNSANQWSPNFFFRRYNNFSPEAKNELFGTNTEPVRRALDDISTLSEKFQHVGALENKSHTGGAMMTGGVVGSMVGEGINPVHTLLSHWDKVLGVGAAAFLLTRPATAESMARAAKIYSAITDTPRTIGTRALAAVNQDLAAKIGKTLGISVKPSDLMPPSSAPETQSNPPKQQ